MEYDIIQELPKMKNNRIYLTKGYIEITLECCDNVILSKIRYEGEKTSNLFNLSKYYKITELEKTPSYILFKLEIWNEYKKHIFAIKYDESEKIRHEKWWILCYYITDFQKSRRLGPVGGYIKINKHTGDIKLCASCLDSNDKYYNYEFDEKTFLEN